MKNVFAIVEIRRKTFIDITFLLVHPYCLRNILPYKEEWIHLFTFLPYFVNFLFAFLHTRSLLITGSTIKGKNVLPLGANSFLL